MTSKTTNKFSPEVRARAVWMVTEHEAEHPSRWAAVSSIAAKIGCSAHTLHEWVVTCPCQRLTCERVVKIFKRKRQVCSSAVVSTKLVFLNIMPVERRRATHKARLGNTLQIARALRVRRNFFSKPGIPWCINIAKKKPAMRRVVRTISSLKGT